MGKTKSMYFFKGLLTGPERLAYLSAFLGVIGQVFLSYFKNIPAGLFFYFFAAAALIINDRAVNKRKTVFWGGLMSPAVVPAWIEAAAFCTILALAAFMRLYMIDTIPAGCFYDEAVGGIAARDILTGKFQPVFAENFGVTSASVSIKKFRSSCSVLMKIRVLTWQQLNGLRNSKRRRPGNTYFTCAR
jgi:hypothetical protein